MRTIKYHQRRDLVYWDLNHWWRLIWVTLSLVALALIFINETTYST